MKLQVNMKHHMWKYVTLLCGLGLKVVRFFFIIAAFIQDILYFEDL